MFYLVYALSLPVSPTPPMTFLHDIIRANLPFTIWNSFACHGQSKTRKSMCHDVLTKSKFIHAHSTQIITDKTYIRDVLVLSTPILAPNILNDFFYNQTANVNETELEAENSGTIQVRLSMAWLLI